MFLVNFKGLRVKDAPETTETPGRPQNPAPSDGAQAGITQATFAARRGVSEAMVSRWKARGLLVLDSDGRVLEGPTNDRLAASLDPARGGDRTGKARPAAPASTPLAGAEGGYEPDPDRMSYQREAARDKRASAMQRELELAKDAGDLVLASDVSNRIAHYVRVAIDAQAARRRRLAPKLSLETDPRRIEEMLAESDREFCQAMAALASAAPRSDAEKAA